MEHDSVLLVSMFLLNSTLQKKSQKDFLVPLNDDFSFQMCICVYFKEEIVILLIPKLWLLNLVYRSCKYKE